MSKFAAAIAPLVIASSVLAQDATQPTARVEAVTGLIKEETTITTSASAAIAIALP